MRHLPEQFGVYVLNKNNITIKNCNIQEFLNGIQLTHGGSNNVINNYLSNNSKGIHLQSGSGSFNNNLMGNTAENNDIGIMLNNIYDSSLTGNILQNNINYGIYLEESGNNNLWINEFLNNNVNAYETSDANGNNWNSEFGNYWDDFGSNPSYPNYYEIDGPGDGIDWYPLEYDSLIFYIIGNQEVYENETLIIQLNAYNPGDNNLTYYTNASEILPSGFSFNNLTGLFEWTPTYGDSGEYDVNFNVTNGDNWDEETITITVNHANRAPVLDFIDDIESYEGDSVFITTSAIDPDYDTLTYFVENENFEQINDTNFVWNTNYTDSGIHEITVKVTDGELWDEQIVTLTVNNVNRAPVLDFIDDIVINETESAIITLSGSDPDNDTLTYFVDDGRFEQEDNVFTWDTDYNDAGIYDLLVSISDGDLTDDQIVTIIINNVPVPDFYIDSSDIYFSNEEPFEDEEVYITAVFYNIDETHPEDILVHFYDGNPENDGILIGEEVILPSLILEDSYFSQIMWDATRGDHDIYVEIDPLNDYIELDETNNIAFRNINLVRPDLIITNNNVAFSNPTPTEDDEITIFSSIRNTGNLDSGEFIVSVYYDNPENMISQQTFSLEVDQTQTLVIDWFAVAGTHEIFVDVDSSDVIFELKEDNNLASNTIEVE
ncbi:putative Ig domain-containing protein, partial [archaeon]|nr:putative Ig domain-containing protein [archaeon]